MLQPSSFLRIRPRYLFLVGASAAGVTGYAFYSRDKHASSLNPSTFTRFSLDSRDTVSSNSKIFTVRQDALSSTNALSDIWRRAIWSVEIKQPQLQIARSYTPLPSFHDVAIPDKEIRLLIKQEKGGEMSTYLHNLPAYATIEMRGPHVECEIPKHTKEVIFLAGGTGIAPALQVARILQQRPGSHISILWANRSMTECAGASVEEYTKSSSGWRSWLGLEAPTKVVAATPPSIGSGPVVQMLEGLRSETPQPSSSTCHVEYFVDEKGKFIKPADVVHRLHNSGSLNTSQGSKIIFISGPDGFVEYWAGKKIWIDGQETQGPLAGVLSRLNLNGWSVWKL